MFTDVREHGVITRLLLDPKTDPWELERVGREHRLRTVSYLCSEHEGAEV